MTAVAPATERIWFVCHACSRVHGAAAWMSGRVAHCPTCEVPLVVPRLPAGPTSDTIFDHPGLTDTGLSTPLPPDLG